MRGLNGRSYLRRVLPYRHLDRSVHGSVITFIDVTVLKETQKQLRVTQQDHAAVILEHASREEMLIQARDLAVAASDLKTRFHASISHELRTPLVGLTGMVEILLDSRLSAEQMDCVQTIRDCSDSLRHLVDDLLDLARIEIDKLVLYPKNCRLDAFVQRLLKPFSFLSAKSGVKLISETKGTPNFLVFDPDRLQQILNNLLGNSLKFTSVGNVKLEIKCLNCTEKTAKMKFSVSDSGSGISEEEGELIFLPFVQGAEGSSGQNRGVGLGLSISHQLVTLMGGKLDFTSELGRGSRFWFELDLPIGDPFETENSTPSARKSEPRINARILLAEDNLICQRVVKIQLEKLGHEVVAVADGLEALEWLGENQEPFDLVILDCQMPRLNGYETARRIRLSQSSFADVPILALTALNGGEEKALCAQVGMDAYLQKPASLELLGESVQKLLSRPHRGPDGCDRGEELNLDRETSPWKQ